MEIFLVLFLLSGQIKAFFQFFGIPVPIDLTVATAAIVVGMVAWKTLKKNSFITCATTFYGIGILLAFFSWMVFSLFYTASEAYSAEKTFFFLLNILAFSVPFFFKDFNIKLFIKLFTLSTIILSIGLLPFQYFDLLGNASKLGKDGAYSAIGGLYLTLSEYLGMIAILLLTKTSQPIFRKSRDILVILLVVGLMILLGARGPILFVVLVFALYYLSSIHRLVFKIKRKTLIWAGSGIMVISGMILLMTRFDSTRTLLSHSIYRFENLVEGVFSSEVQDHSANIRIQLMGQAIDGIFKNIGSFLFGYGIGSFGIMTLGSDIRLYPHNLILEVWFELGLIGLLILTIWLFYILLKCKSLPNRYLSYWLLLYIFLNLMKSSSLIDIRTEFAVLALFITQNLVPSESLEPIPE